MLHIEGVPLLLLVFGYILIKQLAVLLLRTPTFQINWTLGILLNERRAVTQSSFQSDTSLQSAEFGKLFHSQPLCFRIRFPSGLELESVAAVWL